MSCYRLGITPSRAPNVVRVIEIGGKCSLDELHAAIQNAFELDDDHLYAFFMNGNPWDSEHGIWARPKPGERPTTIRLDELELVPNKRFLYLFDYGDELRFDVRVVAIDPNDAGRSTPRIVESIGDAPAQHEWEDEEDEEDEDAENPYDAPSDPTLADLAERLRPHLVGWEWPRDDWDDDDRDGSPRPAIDASHALAIEVIDRTTGSGTLDRIEQFEEIARANVLGWLSALPGKLAEDERYEQAAELSARLLEIADPTWAAWLRGPLPFYLVRAGREGEAPAVIEQNLHAEPEDPHVLYGAARAYEALGDHVREEHLLREVMRFAGSLEMRGLAVRRLVELLNATGRGAEVAQLRRSETARKEKLFATRLGLTPKVTVTRSTAKVGRNDPCPCGSGKKYKKCCDGSSAPAVRS